MTDPTAGAHRPVVPRRRKTSKEERVCSICGQSFKKAEHLARHFRSHTKDKPFECTVCRRGYARQDTLVRHSRCHTGAREMRIGQGSNLVDTGPDTSSGHTEHQASQPVAVTKSAVQSSLPASSPPVDGYFVTGAHPYDMSVEVGDVSYYHNVQQPSQSIFLQPDAPEALGNQDTVPATPWDTRLNSQWPPWLVGDCLNVDELNLSLVQAISEFDSLATHPSNSNTIESSEYPNGNLNSNNAPELRTTTVQQRWHTFSRVMPSGCSTPRVSQGRIRLDESDRNTLSESLRPRVQTGILPSTSFLDLCIQAYFAYFHPIFPVIHKPSFRPCAESSVLLLSVCSIGSLFLGSSRATAHGISIFERLHKAVLASWDTYTSKEGYQGLIALQAGLLGQTFGLLIGRPKDLNGVELFHGSMVAWARKAKLFDLNGPALEAFEINNNSLIDSWKNWACIEEKKRIVLGLRIHDAELSKLYHHEPILRHTIDTIPRPSSKELFDAPDATSWKALMLDAGMKGLAAQMPGNTSQNISVSTSMFPRISSQFEHYILLESIGTLACESRNSHDTWSEASHKCLRLLTLWYEKYNVEAKQYSYDEFCLMILWHAIFIRLHADFEVLEKACGREGQEVAERYIAHAKSWVKSLDAQRCLLHAILIQRLFESIKLGFEPTIHVPLCLYYCGIIWFCFIHFGEGSHSSMVQRSNLLDFPEIELLGVEGKQLYLDETADLNIGKIGPNPVFKVIDLLHRINHWKVSDSFASTLLALVEEKQNIF